MRMRFVMANLRRFSLLFGLILLAALIASLFLPEKTRNAVDFAITVIGFTGNFVIITLMSRQRSTASDTGGNGVTAPR